MTPKRRLGILASGGPAPGINSVIAAATIRARLSGWEVLGIRDGFKWLMAADTEHTVPLTIEDVTPIHFQGGCCIGIDRANPAEDPQDLQKVRGALKALGISHLITIGGDGTAFAAMSLNEQHPGELKMVHVPKSIDNDLNLPDGIPTFGYQTARHVGVRIVKNLQSDARTTSRWYFIVSMGRQTGHLALGIGKAAGTTLTLIPEEFQDDVIPIKQLVDILTGAIIKRLSDGRPDGLAVLAEGLIHKLDPAELEEYTPLARDRHGKLILSEINFGSTMKTLVQERLKQLGLNVIIQARNVGYELRCADPIPFDMEYTRDLGYCATKYLLGGGHGAMITVQHGVFKPIRFQDMIDPVTKRTHVRPVDVNTESYKIARRYMLRLRRDDFEDPEQVARFAELTHLTGVQFREQFEYLVQDEPPPLQFLGAEAF